MAAVAAGPENVDFEVVGFEFKISVILKFRNDFD